MTAAPALGGLNGRTILRFAHAFETGGGTERYLDDLDSSLLHRHALTIYRLHLTRCTPTPSPTVQIIGRGRLILVPLSVFPDSKQPSVEYGSSFRTRVKQLFRDFVLYNSIVWKLGGAKWATRRRLKPEAGQAMGAGKATKDLLLQQRVDLAVLHFFGGADADEVITACHAAGVPVALLNHYSNDRFLHLAVRKHALDAQGIAGVNGRQLPSYILPAFNNLSDGIDVDYFKPDAVRALANVPKSPVILLPARITREKGQLDLVRAVADLRNKGIDCCAAFAGRVDSGAFVDELLRVIDQYGLKDHVHFLGPLNVEELRDWYGASAVVAFPTYHHEGLGRVIIEAQAIARPVVAYATGGVPDAIESGGDGYLVATGDLEGLTARLAELLQSPELQKKMGDRGREKVAVQFSLSALAARHERFYLEVIARHGRKK